MEFYQWLQNNDYVQFVAQSGSIWGFPFVLVLHTVGLALLVGTNAIVDLRVLGAGGKIPLPSLLRTSRIMWIGFTISAASGIVLFLTDPEHRLMQRVFFIKLGLIALALIVTYLIRPVLRREPEAGGGGTPAWAKLLAVSSLFLWAGAICFARLMALQ
jgi:hypothetical protein